MSNLLNLEAEVFFLSRSARDDVGKEFMDSLKVLGVYEVRGDLGSYKSPYAVTANVVFGGAAGMSHVFYRLGPEDVEIALRTGAERAEIGPEWVRIELFRADWPKVDLVHWARRAYMFAREGK
jgi:hypothetical protein